MDEMSASAHAAATRPFTQRMQFSWILATLPLRCKVIHQRCLLHLQYNVQYALVRVRRQRGTDRWRCK